MKLLRTPGIIVMITAIAVTLAACNSSGGGETISSAATTGAPAITTEPAATGVQTTTADNAGISTSETSGLETSSFETTSIDGATSISPEETLPSSATTPGETTHPAPTTTNVNTTSDPAGQTTISPTASQKETTTPVPTTNSGTTAPTTTVISTAKATTTVAETTTASAQKFWSIGENFGWQQSGIKLGTAYSGRVRIYFDMTSPEKAGGSVGFADQNAVVEGYDNLIIVFRMNDGPAIGQEEDTRGYFDASSGSIYDNLATVYYHANITYHVEIEANFASKTYDAWVITPDTGKVKIAEGHDFKSAAAGTADDIGQVFVISKFANDLVYIQNLKAEKVN